MSRRWHVRGFALAGVARFAGFAATGAVVVAVAWHLASARVEAQAVSPRIDAAVEAFLPSITEVRHRIHQHPELSNREFETARLVADHLRALGLEVRTGVAHTGVVALLKGSKPGRVIALHMVWDYLASGANTVSAPRQRERKD